MEKEFDPLTDLTAKSPDALELEPQDLVWLLAQPPGEERDRIEKVLRAALGALAQQTGGS